MPVKSGTILSSYDYLGIITTFLSENCFIDVALINF